jgi:Icc-related predicted phosphoesterase
MENGLNFLAISDVHNLQHQLELDLSDIDVLLNSGDGSREKVASLNYNELADHFEWMADLNVKHKIYVPGNHDTSFQAKMFRPEEMQDKYGITLLNHETVVINGIVIFGSPYTPTFGTGWAYNVPQEKLHSYWDAIPEETDILVTHGPPLGILDKALNYGFYKDAGDKALLERIKELDIKYHTFGHIHEEAGRVLKTFDIDTKFINASVLDLNYKMKNANGIRFSYSK